jgi:hypothetical protein
MKLYWLIYRGLKFSRFSRFAGERGIRWGEISGGEGRYADIISSTALLEAEVDGTKIVLFKST